MIATLEGAGRDRRPRVRDLSLAGAAAVGARRARSGSSLGARLPFAIAAAFGTIIPLPIAPALQPAELALAFGYGLLTALAFALWPLGRAHDVPVSALFRDAVSPERRWPRWRYVIATMLVVAALAAIAVILSYDRKIAADLHRRRRRGVRDASARGAAADGDRAQAAPCAGDGVAARHRQHAPAGRADADHRAVAGARSRAARHDHPDRRQSAAADGRRAAGQGAVVLFPRHSVHRTPSASTPSSASRRRRRDLERVPMLRGRIMSANGIKADDIKAQPNASWVLQSDRGITFAADVPRGSTVVEGSWWSADYQGAAARLVREEDRRRPQSQGRRSGRGQRARPQHRGPHRQSARRRSGKISASISCWCSRPAPLPARRTPTSPR